MRYWLDTEFNEHGGALISIALAAEDGTCWYEVLGCDQPGPWVAQHVMPILDRAVVSRQAAQATLQAYLARTSHAHIVADWPIDISHFCELLITGPGQRLHTPPLTFEIDRDLPSTEDISRVPHNAMWDAIALRDHECRR